MPDATLLDAQSREQLEEFLSSYSKDYAFQKDSIFYDVIAHPQNHFKAFFKIAQLSEVKKMKPFACFPVRRTFIPSYMTLDLKIININILKNKKNHAKADQKFVIWGNGCKPSKKKHLRIKEIKNHYVFRVP